jgi:hypothetical protein
MTKITLAIAANHFGNGTLSLFSSLASIGITADVRLYSTEKSESLTFEVIANNIRSLSPANKSELVYIASDTLPDALSGADFVFLESSALLNDVENGEVFKKTAPDAWYIYRGENAVAVMSGLKNDFPAMKLLLSDDQTDSVRDLLYDVIRAEMKIEKPKHRDLVYNLCGIPYFCFLTDIRYDGVALDEKIRRYALSFPDDFRLSFYSTYGLLPASNKETADTKSDADFRKLIRSLRYGESVLPVGVFTEAALLVKSLSGGGNLVTDVGIVKDGKVIMTSALVQKNICREVGAPTPYPA